LQKSTHSLSRRSFLKGLGGWMANHWLFSTTLIGGGGILTWAGHDTLSLKKEFWDLYYPKLPPALDEKIIVQLSDLHLETLSLSSEKIATAVNSFSPDLIVLTGDLISDRSDLTQVSNYLKPLIAKYGKYMVMGNNDYSHFSRTLFKRYQELLTSIGWIPLINDSEYLKELDLWMIGIDDPATAHDDVPKAYSKLINNPSAPPSTSSLKISSSPFRLVLAHSTDCLDGIVDYGAELFLSGHTHGGQIRFLGMNPMVTNTFLGDQGIYESYHVIDGIPLYINRGIGESGIPIRLSVPPEISIFRLHRGEGPPIHTTI
jgi:uncharacterized protein